MSLKKFFQTIKKKIKDVIFRSRTLPVSFSKPKARPVSVLVSEKFCGIGLGRVGLDYSPVTRHFMSNHSNQSLLKFTCNSKRLHLEQGIISVELRSRNFRGRKPLKKTAKIFSFDGTALDASYWMFSALIIG